MRSNQVRKLVYVIGMGPGNFEQMTFEARRALEQSDVIVGYTVYVDLLREHFPEKQFLTTPMRQEVERCRMAFEEAKKGQTVAMVCSGDAGVYGMSGLILELQQEYPECEVEVVSGVTAALAGGAVLILYLADPEAFSGLLPSVMKTLSLFERFYVFVNGVFDLTAIVYFVTFAAFFLFLSVQSLEKRRYN